jgi:hypothetical protein
MLRNVFLLLALCFAFSVPLAANDPPDTMGIKVKRDVIKLDLAWLVANSFYGSYETILNDESGLQLGLLLRDAKVSLTAAYRYYLSETPSPKGVFLSPMIGVSSENDVSLLGGLLIGKQGFFKNRITLDAYIGPAWIGARDAFTLFGGVSAGIAF